MWNILPEVDNLFEEYLPLEFLKEFNLLDINTTIKSLHYPVDMDSIRQ
jgi:hypothetical protein